MAIHESVASKFLGGLSHPIKISRGGAKAPQPHHTLRLWFQLPMAVGSGLEDLGKWGCKAEGRL